MNFYQNFRLANHLLVLLGFVSLTLCDFLPVYLLLLPMLVIYISEKPSLHNFFFSIPTNLFNTLTLFIFMALLSWVFILHGDLVAAIINFTIYLQLIKVLTGAKNRDYFQIYILSFMHLVAATLLTADVIFIIPFICFIILSPWAFTLYNLKVQLENSYLDKQFEKNIKAKTPAAIRLAIESQPAWKQVESQLRSHNIISSRFFLITAALSLILLINTMAVFFIFPRVSFGFLYKRVKSSRLESGFSEKVDLTSFGEIKANEAIVIRAEPEETLNNQQIENLYWRGLAFDTYQDDHWSRSHDKNKRLDIDIYTGTIEVRKNPPGNLSKFKIIVEPIDTNALFAVDKVYSLFWDKIKLERMLRSDLFINYDHYNSIYFGNNFNSDRTYYAYSALQQTSADLLRETKKELPPPPRLIDAYMQLPEMSEDFLNLAKRISKDLDSNYDRTVAVVNYLQKNYRYTLKVPNYKKHPIEGFLFDKRQGHCEFFASSAVLLLRALHIPTRLVSGFSGGEWNEYGKYIAVRQRHAHTWIEVWFPNYGWQRFDPTPPDYAAGDFQNIRFAALRKLIDSIEMRWYNYIINYGLQSQFKALKKIWNTTSDTFDGLKKFGKGGKWLEQITKALHSKNDEQSRSSWPLLLLVGLCFTAILLTLIWLLRIASSQWMQRRSRQKQDATIECYQEYRRILVQKKISLDAAMTASEVHQNFIKHYPELDLESRMLIDTYYQYRYGKVDPSAEQINLMRTTLDSLASMNRNDEAN
jgi:transglutaminase-like putative cysteine protease